MNDKDANEELIELGVASDVTKGSVMGVEDTDRTLWLHGAMLTDD